MLPLESTTLVVVKDHSITIGIHSNDRLIELNLGGGLPVLLLVRPVDRLEHLLRLTVLLVYTLQQRLDLK